MATVILTVIKIHPVVLELPDRIELPSDEYKSTVINHYTKEANKTTNIVRPSYYIYKIKKKEHLYKTRQRVSQQIVFNLYYDDKNYIFIKNQELLL